MKIVFEQSEIKGAFKLAETLRNALIAIPTSGVKATDKFPDEAERPVISNKFLEAKGTESNGYEMNFKPAFIEDLLEVLTAGLLMYISFIVFIVGEAKKLGPTVEAFAAKWFLPESSEDNGKTQESSAPEWSSWTIGEELLADQANVDVLLSPIKSAIHQKNIGLTTDDTAIIEGAAQYGIVKLNSVLPEQKPRYAAFITKPVSNVSIGRGVWVIRVGIVNGKFAEMGEIGYADCQTIHGIALAADISNKLIKGHIHLIQNMRD